MGKKRVGVKKDQKDRLVKDQKDRLVKDQKDRLVKDRKGRVEKDQKDQKDRLEKTDPSPANCRLQSSSLAPIASVTPASTDSVAGTIHSRAQHGISNFPFSCDNPCLHRSFPTIPVYKP
jgi:hypothetical protein